MRLLSALLAAVVLLTGCSLVSGDDDPEASTAPSDPDQALPAVGWDPVPVDRIEPGGTLRLAVEALPSTFNPQLAGNVDGRAEQVLEPTYGSAVRVTADGGWEVDPDYARAVEVVETSPLTVRVDLNRQAVWQDGQSITAADMVAYWKAQNGSDDDFEVRSTQGWRDIESVTPGDDEYTYTCEDMEANGCDCGGCSCGDEDCYTLNMYDSWGDGWTATWAWTNTATGDTISTGTLASGSSGTSELCAER